MPKGSRREKHVFGNRNAFSSKKEYYADTAAGSQSEKVSREKARTIIGDSGLKKLEKFPMSQRGQTSKGRSYITEYGQKLVNESAKKRQAQKKAATKKSADKAKSSVNKAVKSAVKKVKASAKKKK